MTFPRLPLIVLTAATAFAASAPNESRTQRYERMSRQAEAKGLAEPFVGITTDGHVQPGLYSLASTGVSTEPVRQATATFLGTLTSAQRKNVQFAVDDPEWRKWMNQHFYVRQGLAFRDMNDRQRDATLALLRAALSAKGLQLSQDIMHLNYTLGELNHEDFEQFSDQLYFLTVMGEPSATEPWGWQLEGHHLVINYFVLRDQVVMSPVFLGSEPVTATSGKYKGTSILQDEQNEGLRFAASLTTEQKQKAILSSSKTGNNSLTEAFKDNVVLDYAGLRATELQPAQKQQLANLIALYVDNLDDGHAKVKMDEVRAHLDETYFAWMGKTDADAVFYYRIQSPVILIEYDHQLPANLRQLAENPRSPTRNHVHVVVRTPNGNDYGKDLLRQHYQQHPHAHGSE